MVTADTNVAVYALARGEKSDLAETAMASADFLSVQVLNEYANVGYRKLGRAWHEVARDIALLRQWVGVIRPLEPLHNDEAIRIAGRYQLPFYDALMLAVALSNGAQIFFSEDLQHDFLVDGVLRIVDPFRPGALSA